MNLSKQIHILSVDTSLFYDEKENEVYDRMKELYLERMELKKQKPENEEEQEIIESRIYAIAEELQSLKEKLTKELFTTHSGIRYLNEDKVGQKHVISIFESVFTRTLKLQTNQFTDSVIVVQTFFFEILKDIIVDGFTYKDERYILYTASAGQIRTKKCVFVKESLFKEHELSLVCGLTVDEINNHKKEKGMNINKFLSYRSLSNSATDEWKDFNVKKTIVVDDLETIVETEVDFIHRSNFEIERKVMPIPINHTDGCGMILPSLSDKAFMIRMPWVKGLLVPFDFHKFATIHGNTIVKDIYGVEHDIVKDGIEVIFTKSQFKMAKYYKNWADYQKRFKKHKCQAGKCNEEPDFFPNATLTYQMLQTLNEMTDKELQSLSQPTVEIINSIGRDKDTTFKVLGVDESNIHKNAMQTAIETYPNLLRDGFVKERIKEVKRSLIKRARAGKIEIDGKYSFIVPDLYAFCEHLFNGVENPEGIIKNGEVHCKLFESKDELDVLRSPHLYREHALRKNTYNEKTNEWFLSNPIYTSIHDPITKLLMNDNDGDTTLVTADKTLVKCAKRHMKGIVPLFYEMETAKPSYITNESLYSGMISAYTGGNIGEISNNISKIWNADKVDLNAVKWLTMNNNFTIDYAKTLFKLQTPPDKKMIIKSYTKDKLPHFFVYAKDKEKHQVTPANNSTVNKLKNAIPNNRVRFENMGLGEFDYKLLMTNPDVKMNKKITELYKELNMNKRKLDLEINGANLYREIKNRLLTIKRDEAYVTDVLIHHLFVEKPNSRKETLWECFGWTMLKNLRRNLGLCEKCGVEIEAKQAKKFCDDCAKQIRKEYKAEKEREYRKARKN